MNFIKIHSYWSVAYRCHWTGYGLVFAQIILGDGTRPGRVVATDHGRPIGGAAKEEAQIRCGDVGLPRFLENLQSGFIHVDDRAGADLRLEQFMERL